MRFLSVYLIINILIFENFQLSTADHAALRSNGDNFDDDRASYNDYAATKRKKSPKKPETMGGLLTLLLAKYNDNKQQFKDLTRIYATSAYHKSFPNKFSDDYIDLSDFGRHEKQGNEATTSKRGLKRKRESKADLEKRFLEALKFVSRKMVPVHKRKNKRLQKYVESERDSEGLESSAESEDSDANGEKTESEANGDEGEMEANGDESEIEANEEQGEIEPENNSQNSYAESDLDSSVETKTKGVMYMQAPTRIRSEHDFKFSRRLPTFLLKELAAI